MTEPELASRIVDALLRENYGDIAGRVHEGKLRLTDGRWIALEADGFQSGLRTSRGTLTMDDVFSLLEAIAPPQDSAGVEAFAGECRQALTELRLRARRMPDPATAGPLRLDAIAAALPHPVYPASPARPGLSEQDIIDFAPEFGPRFQLHWVALPLGTLISAMTPPAWWPRPADLGLTGTGDLLPVHPLTARKALNRALAERGLSGRLAPRTYLTVRPTLSMRTVAVSAREHLKLPVPLATLGQRNLRSLKPATLADGALVYKLLARHVATDPRLSRLVLADDTGYAHAGHPFLGCLLRRLPPRAETAVPIAALTDPGVLREISGGDPLGFLAGYFELLFGIHVRLLTEHGIALEAHQQNAAVIPGDRLRLLVKDYDGTLMHARNDGSLPRFADDRMITRSRDSLADVFITIVVHLCVGALAFSEGVPTATVLGLARQELQAALDRAGATRLRDQLLHADRLPVKAMVTAGTLADRARLRAADINKCYLSTGPNYLRAGAWTRA